MSYLLHALAQRGDLAGLMAEVKAHPENIDELKWGVTPMFYAAQNGYDDCITALAEAGATVEAIPQEASTNSPLRAAAENGHAKCIMTLVKAGANVNLSNRQGCTPIMAALSHVDCITALVGAGANVDAVNGEGMTALMLSAYVQKPNALRALLAAGAALNIKCRSDKTAVDYARGYLPECVQMLEDAAAAREVAQEPEEKEESSRDPAEVTVAGAPQVLAEQLVREALCEIYTKVGCEGLEWLDLERIKAEVMEMKAMELKMAGSDAVAN